MTSIFILCAGSGDRWNEYLGVPKQLISFGGVKLLERTARQVGAITRARTFCVTRDARISAPSCHTLPLPPNDALAETIRATAPYWTNRNIFLLGDVFYSEFALDTILRADDDLIFFGRPWPSAYVACGHGEMFAASFSSGRAGQMFEISSQAIAAQRIGGQGNLWNLYQLAGGLALGSCQRIRSLLHPIDDYTNDIDTPVDYERRRALYEKIASGRMSMLSELGHRIVHAPKHALARLRWQLKPRLVR